mgnify:CR=1 FL=1
MTAEIVDLLQYRRQKARAENISKESRDEGTGRDRGTLAGHVRVDRHAAFVHRLNAA